MVYRLLKNEVKLPQWCCKKLAKVVTFCSFAKGLQIYKQLLL